MNVLLVIHYGENQQLILPQVVKELKKRRVRCHLVHDATPQLKHRFWTLGLPTTIISMLPLRKFIPQWATIWKQVWLNKIEECTLLEKAGIPVPKWCPLYPDREPDLSGFSEFVVVKPACGDFGAFVRVMQRDKVMWRSVEVKLRQPNGPLLAQEYIHTGPWPVSYRVATVFGEPIYALRILADKRRRPFRGVERNSAFFDGKTIVASSKGCTMDLNVPEDVINLGKRAHAAFPTIPLLGSDIVRDLTTGQLYVLEVNAHGWVFHLTSPPGKKIEQDFGVDLSAQFGGASAVARGLYKRLCEAENHNGHGKDYFGQDRRPS